MTHLPATFASLSVNEAASYLGVTAKTLRRWEAKGLLIPLRTPGGHRRYDHTTLIRFKRNRPRNGRLTQPVSQTQPTLLSTPVQPTTRVVTREPSKAQPNLDDLLFRPKPSQPIIESQTTPPLRQTHPTATIAIVLIATVITSGIFMNSGNLFKDSLRHTANLSQNSLAKLGSIVKPFVTNQSRQKQALIRPTSAGQVLAATTIDDIALNVNVESVYRGNATFEQSLTVTGDTTLAGNLAVEGDTTDIAGILNLSGDNLTSTGDLTIAPGGNTTTLESNLTIGGDLILSDTNILNIGGLTGAAYNAFAASGEGPEESAVSTDNDLFIGGDLEVDGNSYLANATLAKLTINSETITDLTGSGITISGDALQATLGTEIVTGEITNGTILEADLNATNDPTDDYFLSYDATTGGFTWEFINTATASKWTDAGSYIYPTSGEVLGNSTSAGSNKIAGIYLADSSPLYFGTDNDINFSFSTTTLAVTLGSSDINFDANTLFIDGSADRVGIGTTSPNNPLEVLSTSTQLRVAYDTSNYYTSAVSSVGAVTFDATGTSPGFTFSDALTASSTLTVTSTLTANGTFTANGAVNLGDNGDAIAISGTTLALTSNSTGNDITLTSADDILFDDTQLTAAVPVSLADTGLNASLTQGLVDAINDAWDAAIGTSGGLWTLASGVIYPTTATNDVAIGGTTLAASIFGIDESAGTFYFGYDNSANPTLEFEATDGDAGTFGFNTNDSFYFSNANIGLGTTAPNNRLEILSTTTPQLRVAYDTSNYYTSAVSVAGAVTFDATGTSPSFTFSDGVILSSSLAANGSFTLGDGGDSGSVSTNDWSISSDGNLSGIGTIAADGNITLTKADPSVIFDTVTATDTDFWIGVQEDAGSDDDDVLEIGKSTTPGANRIMAFTSSGSVGIGISAPTGLFEIDTGVNSGIAMTIDQDDLDQTALDFDIANTAGDIINVDWEGATTQTAAITGLDLDFANVTSLAASTVYGIRIDDLAAQTTATEYAIYQQGTTWDYGAYFEDDVLANTALSINGLLTANGQVTLGDNGDSIALSGTTIALTSNSAGNDITLTSADDIIFDDLQLSSAIQLTDIDTTLPNSNTGIVDAINDAYTAAALWTNSSGVVHLTTATNDVAIGGTTLAASIFGIDESAGTFYFGYDNSANPTLEFEATDADAGTFGFNTNDSFYFSNANIGLGTTAPNNRLEILSTTTPQLRVAYDTSNYVTVAVGSDGAVTLDSNGTSPAFTISDGITASSTLSVSSTLTANGNFVMGNESGDTVTVNSAAWTFANDTNFTFSGGVNGLSFDTDTLSIDATNNFVGIGTTAPMEELEIDGQAIAHSYLAYDSYFGEEWRRERADVTLDSTVAWGDATEFSVDENTDNCTWGTTDDGINGIGVQQVSAASSSCLAYSGTGTAADAHLIFDADNLPIFLFKTQINATTNHQFWVGMSDAASASSSDPSNGIWFTNDAASGTTWVGQSCSSGTCSTTSSCGNVSTSASGLLMIRVVSTSEVEFFADVDVSNGISMTQCGSDITTNIPTSTLAGMIMNATDASASGNKRLALDFYRVWQDDPVSGSLAEDSDQPTDFVSGADLAEAYPVAGDTNLPAGYIVSSFEGILMQRASIAYDPVIAGITTRSQSLTLGNQDQTTLPLALVGRVPTLVSTTNDNINRGDPITTSTLPGLGMKADKPGTIVGKALESTTNWSESSCRPVTTLDEITTLEHTQTPPTCYTYNDNGTTIYIGKIMLLINNTWFDPQNTTQELALTTASLNSELSALRDQVNTLSLGKAGDLPEEESQVTEPETNPDTDLEAQISALEESVASTSAELTAEIDSVKGSLSLLQDDVNLLKGDVLGTSDSPSPTTPTNNLLTDQTATLSGLLVTGDTVLNNLGVTGDITAGLLVVNGLENSINSLGLEPLKLQTNALAGIDILSGQITIDNKGNMLVNANLTVTGHLKASAENRGTASVKANAGSTTITFPNPKENTDYALSLTPHWETTIWISDKKKESATANFGTPAPETATLDWLILE